MFQRIKDNHFVLLVSAVYLALTILCLNNCYFWDNIQQITKEAHWFYLNDFKLFFIPRNETVDGISGTGYHPPLMALMTAILWKVVTYKLWISHVFTLVWAGLLIYNTRKLIQRFFSQHLVGWVLAIVLLESTLLTQFAIASPDFILFTAFVVSLRAMFERKNILLAVAVFFLCCINMRGVFVGVMLFLVHNYYSYLVADKKYTIKTFRSTISPYLPTLLVLISYFSSYLLVNGWFFNNSNYADHYSMPHSTTRIIKHLAEFVLRSVENGRILVWVLGIYLGLKMIKEKILQTPDLKALSVLFISLSSLYLLFVFISQMPFSSRYFMPQFFVLSLLVLLGIVRFVDTRKRTVLFLVLLLFELSGHLWIYPDKIAKCWDGTLAHLPFYELRKDCLDYIDEQKIDYKDISAGFSLYGDRRFVDLKKEKQVINSTNHSKYFIYSNISNVEDSFADSLSNPTYWQAMKRFDKGFVQITLYKRK